MKFLLLLFSCFLSYNIVLAQQEQTVSHHVSQATIYTNRAMLTRQANVALNAGTHAIRFDRIPDNMDLRSIRVVDPKDKNIEILGISWERIVTKEIDNKRLAELEKTQLELNAVITEKNDHIAILNVSAGLMTHYQKQLARSINEQAYQNTLDTIRAQWQDALNVSVKEGVAIADSIAILNQEIKRIQERVNSIHNELSKYFSSNIRRSHICLTVSLVAKTQCTLPLQVSYLTYAASWNPLYTVRFGVDDKDFEFGYNGVVYQHTGETWSDVALTLSTAQPHISATPPSPIKILLTGRFLNDNEQYEHVDKMVATNDAVTGSGGVIIPELEEGFSTVSQEGPSVTFKIKGNNTVLSGNQPTQVVIAQTNTDVKIIYECIPSVRQGVYMKALFKNQTSYPILPGSVELYRNSGYVGNTSFKYSAPGAEIAFFAGMLNNVGTRCDKVKQYSRIVGTFSSTEETYDTNDVFITNNTNEKVTICLKQQIPVSEIEEVKVSIISKEVEFDNQSEIVYPTTEGYSVDEKTGIIVWNVTIAPLSTEKITLSYSVSKPYKGRSSIKIKK